MPSEYELRSCRSKVRHKTAKRAARHARAVNGQMTPYRCAFCRSWHVGH